MQSGLSFKDKKSRSKAALKFPLILAVSPVIKSMQSPVRETTRMYP